MSNTNPEPDNKQSGTTKPDNQKSDTPAPDTPHENNGKKRLPTPPTPQVPLWMILLFIVLFVFLVSSIFSRRAAEIPYSDFLRLVELGKGSKEAIRVIDGSDRMKVTIKYSELDDLYIDSYAISGTVTREIVAPEKLRTKEPEKRVRFSSGRQGFVFDNGMLLELLRERGFEFKAAGQPNFFYDIAPTLFILLIMIPIIIFLFRYLGGGGAMAFSRSRGRQVSQEDINIKFSDVAGVDEAVEELKETVAFLKTPEKFQALGGRIPRGVLLVGPPGTGKTILAKAVAGEANVPFFSLSGSDFVELYVGVGAARVRDLFEQAQRCGRAIIFIDELDAIGKIRSGHVNGGASEEREQTLNALLVEMDGFNTNTTTIVIAATNRPESLDPALLRPGRFDRQVLVDRPDLLGREAILKVHVKEVKLDPSIDLKEIASISAGFVGADLAALVNEAALLAARSGKETITMVEFNEGVERITTGLQKKQRVIRPVEKKRIAFHECGHALVAFFTPAADKVHKVSIIPRGLAALGYTLQRPEDDRYLMTQNELEALVTVFLGGTIAEELTFGDFSTGASNDLERATEIARSMVMDYGMSSLGRINYRENRHSYLNETMLTSRNHSEQTAFEIDQAIKTIMQALFDRTKILLEDKRDKLEILAETLLQKEVIENEELSCILEGREYLPKTNDSDKDASDELK
ncbi:MAG: ATP-dependent zinc metalloprotease FtsH [Planctomycetaceae bacterium]|jgi:cell division protease FtsH|nr:ATP-dependent zinc metalloprotease FtsH [Planctomycetaceae bacterium]